MANHVQYGISTAAIKASASFVSGLGATVRTGYGLTEWSYIEQGVRQGCILSPNLFNIYSGSIMSEALEGFEGSIKVGSRTVTNLRYADAVALLAVIKVECGKTKEMLISKNSN